MRGWWCVLLLCSLAMAQETGPGVGPDFSRAARPRGSFYVNGIAHQFLQGKEATVVVAAIPTLNGKYFGVKLHVFNRGQKSFDVLPESVTVEDSVGASELKLLEATQVADKLRRQPVLLRAAGIVAGEPPAGAAGSSTGVPTMADLLRELTREAGGSGAMGFAGDEVPALAVRGEPRASGHDSVACDLGCELRNREIGDGKGPQLARHSAHPEQIEQGELLANTVPPEGDAEGILYFGMPKLTDKAPISHHGRKSYLVTVTVLVGTEKFQFAFPPE